MQKLFLLLLISTTTLTAQSNPNYWQQHVDYTMNIDVDVENYQYTGTQKLIYTNNSPNVLNKVFYHLYFNAFQPGTEMDLRLQNIVDPDFRMVNNVGSDENPIYESKIAKLTPNEIGFLKVISLKQNGKKVAYTIEETMLEVTLHTPIQPGEKVTFDMKFEGQVPKLIRRAGRNSEDGIALSMGQWYPKMVEYDFEGWQAHPYIGREFQGVWGNFDVKISIDKKYTIGGTGYLQNPQEIGHGYQDVSKKLKKQNGTKLTWHFIAPKVHDFTWAADANYKHDVRKTKCGVTLHFFYKNEKKYKKAWKEIQPYTEQALDYFNKHIGAYPWKQYSVIQGGDGGMEYAMCTLISGGKKLGEIVGTLYHELAHSWFQQLLASNESKHSWMDEGFATYISTLASNKILKKGTDEPTNNDYLNYFYAVENNIEEPLTTHADRFNTNTAFNIGSYTKGSMFLTQLNYIIGKKNTANTIKKFYTDFKFTHPTPNDIKRTAEKVSGLQLDWYLNEWIETVHTIDYAVTKVNNKSIEIARVGQMPMPIDITVTYIDDTKENFYIPLNLIRGEKPTSATILKDWSWGKPTYSFMVKKKIKVVEIDASGLMADVNRNNNIFNLSF